MATTEANNEFNQLPLNEILSLQPSPDGAKGKYICPCGSGSKGKGSGALTDYRKEGGGWYCHACGKDTLQLLADHYGITAEDSKEIYKLVGERLHAEGYLPSWKAPSASAVPLRGAATPQGINTYIKPTKAPTDQLTPEALDYLHRRGIADSVILRHRVSCGKDEKGVMRIYFPISPDLSVWTARRLEESEAPKYRNSKGELNIEENIFPALMTAEEGAPFWIVEGIMDSLALESIGHNAIPLMSASNYRALAKYLAERPIPAKLILALDNDSTGQKAQSKLAEKLEALGIDYVCASWEELEIKEMKALPSTPEEMEEEDSLGYKPSRIITEEWKHTNIHDTSEYLEEQPEGFKAWADREAQREKHPPTLDYLQTTFAEDCKKYEEQSAIYTGIAGLDDKLNGLGGLRPALYILGAESSLGKTTLALQIADNVARQGKHSAFITLEQTRRVMLAKSLSRLSWECSGANRRLAMKASEISEAFARGASPEGKASIEALMKLYEEKIGARQRFIEGNYTTTFESIARTARTLKDRGQLDFLVIDYLQIIRGDDRLEDRRRVDRLVGDLKILSNELFIPILAISSLNRGNYYSIVGKESFKESGGIEYGVDSLIGMYYSALKEINPDEAKKPETREKLKSAEYGEIDKDTMETKKGIILNCCKNREGAIFHEIPLDFFPAFSGFYEKKQKL